MEKVGFLIVSAIMLFSYLPAASASTQLINVFPETSELLVNSGDRVEDTIYILRPFEDSATLRITIQPTSKELSGIARELADRSATSWITLLSPSIVEVPLQSAVAVTYQVHVPESVESGEWYAWLEIADERSAQVYRSYAIVIQVTDARNPKAMITFSAAERRINFQFPVDVLTGIENTGTVRMIPEGTLQIVQGDRVIESMRFNASGDTIYPGVYREFRHQWDPSLSFGRYTLVTNVFIAGISEPLRTESIFWVLPWGILLGAFLILLGILVAMYWALQSYLWRRIEEKELQYVQILLASALPSDLASTRHLRSSRKQQP